MDARELIPVGSENKISRHDLIRRFIVAGVISSERDPNREMMRVLHELRQSCVIIASGSGIYRPDKNEIEDIRGYIAKERHRIKEINSNLKYAEKYFSDLVAGRID